MSGVNESELLIEDEKREMKIINCDRSTMTQSSERLTPPTLVIENDVQSFAGEVESFTPHEMKIYRSSSQESSIKSAMIFIHYSGFWWINFFLFRKNFSFVLGGKYFSIRQLSEGDELNGNLLVFSRVIWLERMRA